MTRSHRFARRALRRLLLVLAVVVGALVAAPGVAQAHPTLLYTTPAADTAEAQPPTSLVLVFNEPVTVAPGGLVVLDRAGRTFAVDQVTAAGGGTAVTGRLTSALPVGVYTVRWRATGADGDLVESTFRFAVGAAITSADATSTAGSGARTSWPSAGWRWLLFAGLALALGGAVGGQLSDSARAVRASLPALNRWQAAGAVVGLAGAVGRTVTLVAKAGAGVLVSATPGRVIVVEAVAFAACLALLRPRRGWAWLPLLAVPVAEGVRGHVQQAQPGWGALLIGVHLAAAAVWVGALVHVARVAVVWRGQRPAVRWVLTGYARWAAWLFAGVVVTGTVSALLVMPLSAVTTTPYGRWLLVKLALVAVAAAAAGSARWWLRRGDHTLPRIRWATRVEAAVLTAVLGATAVLVSTPTSARAPLAPPPPRGVVVPLGALAGQVGVAVAASDGQLVVRLAVPRRGDYYTPTDEASSFTLAGRVVAAGQVDRVLRWQSCGTGCFLAPVTWGVGDNLLTLRAEASGWAGGTVSMVVPWPVQPASGELARAVAATQAAGPVTVYEAVTSDTSTSMPAPTPLRMSGAEFVATEPYSSGVAPQAVTLRADSGTTRLAVGFPAEGRYAELVLDAKDRIVQEVLVDAKHLTRRRFVYTDKTEG